MGLSDQLLKLSQQAKDLEASAEAAKNKNDEAISKRKAELEDFDRRGTQDAERPRRRRQ